MWTDRQRQSTSFPVVRLSAGHAASSYLSRLSRPPRIQWPGLVLARDKSLDKSPYKRTLDGFRCEVLEGGDSGQYKSVKRESGLVGEAEQLADEVSLAGCISFGQPSHSTLPDHVHCLDTLQRPPRTLKGSIALGQPNSLFDCSVSGLALGAGHVAAANCRCLFLSWRSRATLKFGNRGLMT